MHNQSDLESAEKLPVLGPPGLRNDVSFNDLQFSLHLRLCLVQLFSEFFAYHVQL